MPKTITVQERQRYGELRERAISRYLENEEFYPEDWLSDEDADEYSKLDRKING